MKSIKLLGVEGKKIDIIPTASNMKVSELYSKKGDYIGMILYDKKWKKFVLVELDKDMQISRSCINEAFDMAEKFWEEKND